MPVATYIFWSTGALIFYTYVGYPIVLWLVSVFKQRRISETATRYKPMVTLLISAYNEESVIEEKIKNSLALHYPRHLLEIIVVSDGSTDRTNEIVTRYASEGVQLRSYEGRIGKSGCLNNTVPLARGEIIVFSDANSQYDKEAIRHLVQRFTDHRVGFVSGSTIYISKNGHGDIESISLYSRLEIVTKTLESNIGSCIGADGAIFAVRKSLFQQLRSSDINDFVIPLNVINQGFQGKLVSNAFCVETTTEGLKDQFGRQIRITNRTIRAIMNHIHLLNPIKYGFLSFELASHKICKLFVPFFLLLLLSTNLILTTRGPFYILTFTIQLLFYLMASLNHSHRNVKGLSKLISLAHTFTLVNVAILIGWIKYLRGETYITWSPSQR